MKFAPSTAHLNLLAAKPGHFALFAWKNATVVCWVRTPTAAVVTQLNDASEPFLRATAHGASTIHLVGPSTGLPDGAARAAFVDGMHRFEGLLFCAAVVTLGGGFWASALQSVVTGMRALYPGHLATRVHRRSEQVVEWLPSEHFKYTQVRLDPAQLLLALREAENCLCELQETAA